MKLSQTMRLCVVSHTRDLIEEYTALKGAAPSPQWLARHIGLFVAGDEETGELLPDHDREQVAEAVRLCAETARLHEAGMLTVHPVPMTEAERVMKVSRATAEATGRDLDDCRLVLAARQSDAYTYDEESRLETFTFRRDGSKLLRGLPMGDGLPVWEAA